MEHKDLLSLIQMIMSIVALPVMKLAQLDITKILTKENVLFVMKLV
jgi:hypothetical protein